MSQREEIRRFIVDTFLFGEDGDLKDDSSFLEEGIVDSTGIMQLVAFLQEEYLIAIEDEELIPDNLDSIRKIVAFLERKRVATGPQLALADAPPVG
jgi:acyl carrier protein